MAKQIYIHGGFLKTGSTYIQNNLSNHRKYFFENHGVYFWGKNSSVILRSLCSPDPYNFKGNIIQNRTKPSEIDKFNILNKSSIFDSIDNLQSRKFLISAESVSSYSEEECINLCKLFQNYECKIIFFIRNPLNFINSFSQELVKQGMHLNYLSMNPPFASYEKKLETFMSIFGKENLIFINYDDSTNLIKDLMNSIEILFDEDIQFSNEDSRESISNIGIKFLDEYNFFYPRIIDGKLNPQRRYNINNLYGIASRFEGDKFKLAIDQSLKDKVMQKLSDELTWLKGHGLDFEINSKDLLFRNDAYEKYLKKSNIVDKAHDELTQNEK